MIEIATGSVSRRRWIYGAVAGAAALGGAGLAWWRHTPADVAPDALSALWGTKFDAPNGQPVAMSAFRGRPLLINFWATWCPPCVEELPLLDAFYQQNKSNGWQVLGLAVDRAAPVADFLARQPLSFAVALAGLGGMNLSKSLGNSGGGLPFTVVLDAAGALRDRKIGKASAADLARWHGLK